MVKSRRLRWAGHVGRMEEDKSAFKMLQERDLSEGLGVDGRTILKLILKKLVSIRGIGLIQLRIWIFGVPLGMWY